MPKAREAGAGSSEVLSRLKRNPLFAPCADELLRPLAVGASIDAARRGTRIAPSGTPFPFIGVVCSGAIAVTVNAEGPMRGVHRLQLYEARAGALFGEVAFLAEVPAPGDVLVVSKRATYALLRSDLFESAIEKDPSLLRRLAAHVARRTYLIARDLLGSQGRPLTARVAAVLLRYCAQETGLLPASRDLTEMTQSDLGAAAGCVKESAARVIGYLESAGALKREHGHIAFLDRAVLSEYLESQEAP